MKTVAGEGKKCEFLGPPPLGTPLLGAPPFGAPPFGVPKFNIRKLAEVEIGRSRPRSDFSGFPDTHQIQNWIGPNWIGPNWIGQYGIVQSRSLLSEHLFPLLDNERDSAAFARLATLMARERSQHWRWRASGWDDSQPSRSQMEV